MAPGTTEAGEAHNMDGIRAGRWLTGLVLVGCLVGVFAWMGLPGSGGGSGARSVAEASTASGAGASGVSLDSLVVPGVQSLDEGQQTVAAQQARLSSAVAYVARMRSRTAFSHLGAARAAQVAREAFPAVVDRPAGGPPQMPAGTKLARYIAPNAARLELPGGRHAVVESLGTMAKEASPGHFTPIDLALTDTSGGYAPAASDVTAQIPKHLSSGVSVRESGISLTPVDASGIPLEGSEGVVDGASVLYTNVQTDTDTFVKPTNTGFEVSAIQRSADSPSQLYYRVGMPAGASLVQQHSTGSVKVVDEGAAIARVAAPDARDAAGTLVPVSMTVKNDLLVLDVEDRSGEYEWPIEVDPELEANTDKVLTGMCVPSLCHGLETNWKFLTDNESIHHTTWWCQCASESEGKKYDEEEQSISINPVGNYGANEYGGVEYETQGESRIYGVETGTKGDLTNSGTAAELEMRTHEGVTQTNHKRLASGVSYREPNNTICARPNECEPQDGSPGNMFRFMAYTTEAGTANWWDVEIYKGYVYVAQENGPESSFNTSSTQIANASNRQNVLYGAGSWLSPSSGAFEVAAHDPGIGVGYSYVRQIGGSFIEKTPIYEEGKCKGFQCKEIYNNWFTYNPKMADGEDAMEMYAEDGIGFWGSEEAKIKVDGTPPRNIGFTGMPETGAEISAAPHKLTLHATDGTKPTPSSGVKAIEVSIDGGKQTALSGSSCPAGECTATGQYTLYAEGLTEGVHRLIVTATDNAGNVASKEFLFDVRHANPVSVGPGTVDPTSGQFTLSAKDVSLGGTSGVSRTYQSRSLTAGAEGPFGSQWAISIGGGESLSLLADGDAVLVAAGGGQTTFALNTKGEFESPKGDENLKLEYESKERKYLLKDSVAGAETVFEQPSGYANISPTYSNQFGPEAAKLGHPKNDAIDAKGDVWVTDATNDRVQEFSPAGTLMGTYGSEGSSSGQFKEPWGIAINQSTGNVYVTDETNNRVEELSASGAFVKAFGWGVTDGKEEAEVCTGECKAGVAGSGNGEFSIEAGIAVDSTGNIWVADYGNNRIQEFNEKGEYLQQFGSEGTGNGQFKGPLNIAFSGANLYVTDYGNNRVQEFSLAGKYERQFGNEGIESEKLKNPRGISTEPSTGNLYVVDTGNSRVQEFSSTGGRITKFGSVGSGLGQLSEPKGVAVSSSGGIYVTDYNNSRVEEWARSTWVPTTGKGPAASALTTYSYKAVTAEGKTIIEPSEELGPKPEGAVCSAEPEKSSKAEKEKEVGCRELTFKYGTKTGAGEKEIEWGEYEGRLMEVKFTAYNPSSKEMQTVPVAQYAYDQQGRLRAEWDPRISPALKTIYGYDAEGHVTALTPPGQESWAFTYGTIAGDSNTGRLLKVMRAPASTTLWAGSVLSGISPSIEGSPVVGNTMRASALEKYWGGEPIAFAYQWESCNSEGKGCTPILGATNANYTVALGDVGHKLVAQVTGTNGGGSASVTSAASSLVAEWKPEISEHSLPAGSEPTGIGAKGSVYANSHSNKIGFIAESGEVTEYALPTGSVPEGVAPTELGINYWFTDYGTSKIGKISVIGSITEYALPAGSKPMGITVGPDGNLWFTNYGTSKIGKITTSGTITEYALPAGSDPRGITEGPDGNLWFTDYGTSKIGKITTSGTITEYALPLSYPYAIAQGPDGKLWYTDYLTNEIGKITTAGEKVAEYALPSGSSPSGITQGPDGNLWFTDSGTSKVGKITTSGSISEYALPAHSEPTGIGNRGSSLWFTESGTSKIGSIGAPKLTAQAQPQPGWTLEYHLPVAGTGRPNLPNMTKEEVEKWGQKDTSESEDNDPAEGMAIFPPDEPQGWPASSYKRATIDYVNEKGLSVNMATPSGGISTTEYNALNEVVRTLSPDNQAKAMGEGCKSVSKKECKSAEVAEKLDTKTEYNLEGSEVVKVVGPEHSVKLASGPEVQARAVTHDYYDKGAKEVEEKTHEKYNLETQAIEAALLSTGEEKDQHETVTSYGGQENLGWRLRKPTSVTRDPGGLNLKTATVYQENSKKESTGAVVETRSPKGSGSGSFVAPAYGLSIGSVGSGNGQFKEPRGVAIDSSNNIWAADSENNRIEKLSPTGTYIAAYGSSGSGAGQLSGPAGIAINRSSGNVYVSDRLNMRVEEFSSAGAFVRAFGFGVSDGLEKFEVCTSSCQKGNEGSGNGQFHTPDGVTVDSAGNVWVADYGNNRVEEFSSEGSFIAAYGSHGSGNGQFQSPESVVYDDGLIYVVDTGNNRIEELSTNGAYRGQFGSSGTGNGQFSSPSFIAADPVTGSLYVLDVGNSRVQEFTLSGTFLGAFGSKGTGSGQFASTEAFSPDGIAVSAAGNVYAADTPDNRLEVWIPIPGPGPVGYTSQFGSLGSGNGQFHLPVGVALDASGNQWVTDYSNSRIEKFSSTGTYLAKYGESGTGSGQMIEPDGIAINKSSGNVYISDQANNRVEEFNSSGTFVSVWGFGVSNGEAKFQVCTASCKAGISGSGSGQFNRPGGVSIDPSGNVWVVDESNHRVEEFSSTGSFMAAVGWGVKDGKAEAEVCTTTCQAGISGSGNGQLNKPAYIVASDSNIYVTDYNNNRVERFSTAGAYVTQFGSAGSGNGQFKGPAGITADASGNLFVVDDENNRVEEFTRFGTYVTSFGTKGTGNGQLNEPEGIAVASTGALHVVDSANNRIEEFTPPSRPGNEGAHDAKIVYYSAKGEAEVTACQNHPEWVNLPCQTELVAQPGVSGAPELPVTTTTYNVWDTPETITEKFGSTTRTKKESFDGAGREESSEELSSPATDKALPKVVNTYSKETGALIEQSTTIEGKTKAITSVFNYLGQLEKYTDANGGVTKYVYETSGDGRLDEVNYEIGAEKFEQTYAYDPTTDLMTSLYDSGLKKSFTATYDIEGKMLTDTFPDNLTAHYTYNQVGAATGIKYEKNAYCASKCPETWFEDNIVPSIHGEALKQTSTLAKESYVYDNAGRLTETQETPAGKDCTARLYAYDEESNRTSLTTRESSTEACPTEGGLVESHSYDSANALIDAGITYETFGNTTKLPAPDAGKYELKSSYYVDNQVAGQEQNEKALNYTYDPSGRTEETETIVKGKPEPITVSHYSGPGEALMWTAEEENKKWSRNVPGIDGALDALQTSTGEIVLQLHDLQGNVVAKAGLGETETKLSSTYNNTEFGVPTTSSPPKYAWLGAGGVSSALPSSGTITQGGASYVPQIARSLQTAQVIPPGAFPNGAGSGSPYTSTVSAASLASAQAEAVKATQEAEAARQKAREEEAIAACEANPLSCGEEGDPTEHYFAWEAKEKGEKMIEASEAGDLADLLGYIVSFVESPAEAIGTLFGESDVEAWGKHFGELLVKCAEELHRTKHSHGGCRANIKDITPFGFDTGIINFNAVPEVSWCEGMSSDRKEVHWCTLESYPGEGTEYQEA